MTDEWPDSSSFLSMILGIAAAAVILVVLHGASELVSQFLLAFVITLAVAPIQAWLVRRGMRSGFAFAITAIGTIVAMFLLFSVLTASLNQFIATLPTYEDELAAIQSQIQDWLSSLGFSQSTLESNPSLDASAVMKSVAEIASWLLSAFTSFGFMIFLAGYMLFESTRMPQKIRAIALPARREPVDRFVSNTRNYIVITAWVNMLVAATDTVLLYALGIPFALLWGVLAFLLGFIPSIGFLISLIGPTLLALLLYGPEKALIVVAAFIVINGGVQNFVLPRQMGEGTDLSPAVVFGSLLFWGFVLGPVGAILSVPMTMIVRLALETSESTRGLSYLMSSGKHPFSPQAPPATEPAEGTATP